MRETTPRGHIVVGVDGSRSALRAAIWAVDEAVSRGVALRLVTAVAPSTEHHGPDHAAQQLAAAKIATHHAVMAIEAADRPVKIEVEVDRTVRSRHWSGLPAPRR